MEKDNKTRISLKDKVLTKDEFMAASIGECEWLEQSLRDGHDPNNFDKHGLAPIHIAALHGRLECIQLLVEKFDVDINLPSESGWRPLHLAINKENEERALPCVEWLLENGADVMCTNDKNLTVTHQAASEGLVDCLQVLLDYDAPIDTLDSRKQTPYNLARMWGHKECARLVQQEEWQRKKEIDEKEKQKLKKLKSKYKGLQQEALQQLQNEQLFYNNVTFGNWLEEKGFAGNTVPMYMNEKCTEQLTKGLTQRLHLSGGNGDYAARVENLYAGRDTSAQSTPRNRIDSVYPIVAEKSAILGQGKTVDSTVQRLLALGDVKSSKRFSTENQTLERLLAGGGFKSSKHLSTENQTIERILASGGLMSSKQLGPSTETQLAKPRATTRTSKIRKSKKKASTMQKTGSEAKCEESDLVFKSYIGGGEDAELSINVPPWNFSTNVDSDPVTDIKNPDPIPLSTKPSEEAVFMLSPAANLSVHLIKDESDKFVLTVLRPGGIVENANVIIPSLPSNVIRKALAGKSEERILVPEEFKCIHIYDVQHKRRPKILPLTEIPWHLKEYIDGCCIHCDGSCINYNL